MSEEPYLGKVFEGLIKSILIESGFKDIHEEVRVSDYTFDYIARFDDARIVFEVKYYRTYDYQYDLIKNACEKLLKEARGADFNFAVLIISSGMPDKAKAHFVETYGITIVDRLDILAWVSRNPELIDRLKVLIGSSDEYLSKDTGREPGSIFNNLAVQLNRVVEPDNDGSDLCNELREFPLRKNWKGYEKLMEKILKYLFSSDLHGWVRQNKTNDDLHIFDIVCRINSSNAFWNFISNDLCSRYVVFEFKNYSKKISQGQILTTEKYLFEKSLRRCAFIFSRKGSDRGAAIMASGAMRESGKLLLVLNDDDVCAMLHMKEKGDDPSDYLYNKVDEFLMKLSR